MYTTCNYPTVFLAHIKAKFALMWAGKRRETKVLADTSEGSLPEISVLEGGGVT